jgi:hypothetical protein
MESETLLMERHIKCFYTVLGLTLLSSLVAILIVLFSDASGLLDVEGLGEEIIQSSFLLASYLYMLTCLGPFFVEMLYRRVLCKDHNDNEVPIRQTDLYLFMILSLSIIPLMTSGAVLSYCSPRTVGMINVIAYNITGINITGCVYCAFYETYKEEWMGTYSLHIIAILSVIYLCAAYSECLLQIHDLSQYTCSVLKYLALTGVVLQQSTVVCLISFENLSKKYQEDDNRGKDPKKEIETNNFIWLQLAYTIGTFSYAQRLYMSEFNFIVRDSFVKFLLYNILATWIIKRNRAR